MTEIEIKQATEADIPIIEDILFGAVDWLDSTGKQMWQKAHLTWEALSEWLTVDEFYIAYINSIPVGCMALIDYDPLIWKDIEKGESLFIHRLAVKRIAAGQGVSKALIDYAKTQATKRGITVRLDCWKEREKLRALYEREEFVCVEETFLFGHYHAALYVWQQEI